MIVFPSALTPPLACVGMTVASSGTVTSPWASVLASHAPVKDAMYDTIVWVAVNGLRPVGSSAEEYRSVCASVYE